MFERIEVKAQQRIPKSKDVQLCDIVLLAAGFFSDTFHGIGCQGLYQGFESFFREQERESYLARWTDPSENIHFMSLTFYEDPHVILEESDLHELQRWTTLKGLQDVLVLFPYCWGKAFSRADQDAVRIMSYDRRVDIVLRELDPGAFDLTLTLSRTSKDNSSPTHRARNLQELRHTLDRALLALCDSGSQRLKKQENQFCKPQRLHLHRARLMKNVQEIKRRIQLGDCYLANCTQTYTLEREPFRKSVMTYLEEWSTHPSRFAWSLSLPELQIECWSPERFLMRAGEQLQMEPIKGTAQAEPGKYFEAAKSLWSNPKEIAEQHLVTDLIRNDLSLISQFGSVEVLNPFEVRIDKGLAQMMSTIRGRARPELDFFSLFHDVLPGGSVTGTPKKRVTEILSDLESSRRLYCGVLADVRCPINFDSTLLIRSFFREADAPAYLGVGAGITMLSDPTAEVDEMMSKIRSFLPGFVEV